MFKYWFFSSTIDSSESPEFRGKNPDLSSLGKVIENTGERIRDIYTRGENFISGNSQKIATALGMGVGVVTRKNIRSVKKMVSIE